MAKVSTSENTIAFRKNILRNDLFKSNLRIFHAMIFIKDATAQMAMLQFISSGLPKVSIHSYILK